MEPDQLQQDQPAAYVIAQQYSSITFTSFCCNFIKEELGIHFNNVPISIFFLL
jgi:hypothetical protein